MNFWALFIPGGTLEDLKALTTAQAGIVYRRNYWDAVVGGELPDGVDYALFDFAVNSGRRGWRSSCSSSLVSSRME